MSLYGTRSVIATYIPAALQPLEIFEASADATILPGDVLVETATGVTPVAADNAIGTLLVAVEDKTPDVTALRNETGVLDQAYAADDTVYFIKPPRGVKVQVRATAAVAKGDTLATKGTTEAGQLAPVTPDASTIVLTIKGIAAAAQATVGDRFEMEVV